MHKRTKEYKLVRCGEENRRGHKRFGVRCVLAGLMSLLLTVTAVPAFCFGEVSMITQAGEQSMSDISQGDVSGSDVFGNDVSDSDVSGSDVFGNRSDGQVGRISIESVQAEITREDILIALDAGHGGEDEGSARADVLEKTINLQIAETVAAKLKEEGYQVLMIREGDEMLSLEERVQIANEAGAWIYISIHQNACEETASAVSGVEVWYNEGKAAGGSKRLADLIHNDLVLYTQAKDRGVVADESLYITRETNMPACLVETGFLSNAKERELLCTEDYQERIAEGIVSGIDLYFFPKTMYLTFDDGPSPENTMVVLDTLKEKKIKATFFLIGENVERNPEVARRIVEEGHAIGIHCYNHDYDKLYESVDSYLADFEKAKTVIYEITGVETRLFRFPGGSINAYNAGVRQDVIDRMTQEGYIYYDWNASLEDACRDNAPEKLLKNAKESTMGRKRVIMLAHDVVYNTTLCLEELLEQFPEYRMMPLSEDVEPIQF